MGATQAPIQKIYLVRSNDGATIEQVVEEPLDMGTIGEDIEAHYVQANNLQSRGKSYNPRSNVPSKLLRTLDDNINTAPAF